MDQRAAPQLLPHLPGAPCAQHPPGSHRLRGPRHRRGPRGAQVPPCSAPLPVTGQRTAPEPTEDCRPGEAFTAPRQSQRQTASRWQSGLVSCFPEISSPRGIRFLVFVFGDVASSSRCHIYSLIYIVFSDRCYGASLCNGLFLNPFGLPFLDSVKSWTNFFSIQLVAKGRMNFPVQRNLFRDLLFLHT